MSSPIFKACIDRRGLIAGLAFAVMVTPASATPEAMARTVKELIGETAPQRGRIHLEIPPLIENGNAVPMTVRVDSPMTADDRVAAIHVVNEKNPQPHVVSVRFSSNSARAQLSTRIKLAASQRVTAYAQMSDGSVWFDTADVIVTIAACVEDLRLWRVRSFTCHPTRARARSSRSKR